MAPIASLSCKESFIASHILKSPHLSNTGNKKNYGICNNSFEHSHKYSAQVIARGTVDSSNGIVTSMCELKSCLREIVIEKLDGKHLNNDIGFFKTIPPTMENLAIFIWQSMKRVMEVPELLHEVKLTMWVNDEENSVVYNGKFQIRDHLPPPFSVDDFSNGLSRKINYSNRPKVVAAQADKHTLCGLPNIYNSFPRNLKAKQSRKTSKRKYNFIKEIEAHDVPMNTQLNGHHACSGDSNFTSDTD